MLIMQGVQVVQFVLKELFQMKEQDLVLLVHVEKLQEKGILIVMINKTNEFII